MTRKAKFLTSLPLVAVIMILATCQPITYYLERVYKAYGKVVEGGTSIPLESVEVFVDTYQYSDLTNGLGDYEIELAEGTWVLSFVKDGYITEKRTVTVNAKTPRVKVDVGIGKPPELVAEYLFNGNADDTSGNGHNGVVYGAIATSDRFGMPNRAYYFDNSFVEVSDPPGHLFNPNSAFSISVWLNLANDSAFEHFPFISQDEGPGFTHKWYFNYRTHDVNGDLINAFSFHVADPSMANIPGFEGVRINSDPITLQLDTWHHVVLVRYGKIFRFYVDSLAIGNVTSDVVIPDINAPLRIGFGEAPEYLIGSADDVRIYNYALTAAEVSGLFHEGGWTGN
jgi:hypothetical protein